MSIVERNRMLHAHYWMQGMTVRRPGYQDALWNRFLELKRGSS